MESLLNAYVQIAQCAPYGLHDAVFLALVGATLASPVIALALIGKALDRFSK